MVKQKNSTRQVQKPQLAPTSSKAEVQRESLNDEVLMEKLQDVAEALFHAVRNGVQGPKKGRTVWLALELLELLDDLDSLQKASRRRK